MSEKYTARIPDDDAHDWINTLIGGGFSAEEVDRIMMHLNDTYVEKKHGTALVDRLLDEAEDILLSRNVEITTELRRQLREWVIQKIRSALE